jgi:copper chaperone CopZ
MRRVALATVACGALLGLSFGTLSLGPACTPAGNHTPPAEATLELQVGGMHCEPCAVAITAAVTKLDGVTACEVDHASGRAVVRHDPARASAAAISAEITKLGYTVAE